MKDIVNNLKGGSCYVGASKIHWACCYILYYLDCDDYDMMINYYPSLVEAVLEFKVESRKMLAKFYYYQY